MPLFQVSMAGYTWLCIHTQRASYEWRTDNASRRLFTLQTTLCLDLICCRGCIITYPSTSLSPFPLPKLIPVPLVRLSLPHQHRSNVLQTSGISNPNGRAPMSDDLPVLPVRLRDSLFVGPTWACQHKNSGFSNFRWIACIWSWRSMMKGVAPRCNFAIRILDRCVFSMTYSSSAFVNTNERVTLGRDHGSKIQTQHFGALTSIYPRIDKDWMPRTLKWDTCLVFNYTCSFKRSDGLHFPGRCYHFSLIGYDE